MPPKTKADDDSPVDTKVDNSHAGMVPVYNINDGPTGRNGGPYLDEELARDWERKNARAENREPDYSDLTSAPHPGVMLVTAEQLILAHRTAGGIFTGEVTAPIYGYIPDPTKAEEERLNAASRAEAKRAEVVDDGFGDDN